MTHTTHFIYGYIGTMIYITPSVNALTTEFCTEESISPNLWIEIYITPRVNALTMELYTERSFALNNHYHPICESWYTSHHQWMLLPRSYNEESLSPNLWIIIYITPSVNVLTTEIYTEGSISPNLGTVRYITPWVNSLTTELYNKESLLPNLWTVRYVLWDVACSPRAAELRPCCTSLSPLATSAEWAPARSELRRHCSAGTGCLLHTNKHSQIYTEECEGRRAF